MALARLYVAIYRPQGHGNFAHWALCLEESGGLNTIFQMRGEQSDYWYEERSGKADDSRSLREKILVSEVQNADIAQLKQIAADTEIDNEVPSWDCQEWVLDVLAALVEACIIGFFTTDDEDEEREFNRTMRYLKRQRGPEGI